MGSGCADSIVVSIPNHPKATGEEFSGQKGPVSFCSQKLASDGVHLAAHPTHAHSTSVLCYP